MYLKLKNYLYLRKVFLNNDSERKHISVIGF